MAAYGNINLPLLHEYDANYQCGILACYTYDDVQFLFFETRKTVEQYVKDKETYLVFNGYHRVELVAKFQFKYTTQTTVHQLREYLKKELEHNQSFFEDGNDLIECILDHPRCGIDFSPRNYIKFEKEFIVDEDDYE
jgi:hypothetical protein